MPISIGLGPDNQPWEDIFQQQHSDPASTVISRERLLARLRLAGQLARRYKSGQAQQEKKSRVLGHALSVLSALTPDILTEAAVLALGFGLVTPEQERYFKFISTDGVARPP